ncbi:uncharacterized protein Dere_GG26469 [Drosophila erecta]|nr:uncharacterized protein Dere_GG26469 [Drosophila erecta]
MKSFFVIFGVLLISTQIAAQTTSGCPEICPAVYSPVCVEATINGKLVRCLFSNSCQVGVSTCRRGINWCKQNEEKCEKSSPTCSQYR